MPTTADTKVKLLLTMSMTADTKVKLLLTIQQHGIAVFPPRRKLYGHFVFD